MQQLPIASGVETDVERVHWVGCSQANPVFIHILMCESQIIYKTKHIIL